MCTVPSAQIFIHQGKKDTHCLPTEHLTRIREPLWFQYLLPIKVNIRSPRSTTASSPGFDFEQLWVVRGFRLVLVYASNNVTSLKFTDITRYSHTLQGLTSEVWYHFTKFVFYRKRSHDPRDYSWKFVTFVGVGIKRVSCLEHKACRMMLSVSNRQSKIEARENVTMMKWWKQASTT